MDNDEMVEDLFNDYSPLEQKAIQEYIDKKISEARVDEQAKAEQHIKIHHKDMGDMERKKQKIIKQIFDELEKKIVKLNLTEGTDANKDYYDLVMFIRNLKKKYLGEGKGE